jgi:hypothetical protein
MESLRSPHSWALRFNMYDFINLTFQFVALMTGIVVALVTILLNWVKLKKSWRSKDIKNAREKVSVSRRSLIKSTGIMAASFAGWGLLQIKPIKERIERGIYYFLPQGKNLIVNKRNGTIHHKLICKNHLPKNIDKSSPLSLASNSRFHGSYKVAILSKITEGVSAEDAIEILMLATENSPTSVHLYDKVVKLLGKIKRYESIHLLLDSAERKINELSSQQTKGSKKHKECVKASLHIQKQKEKSRSRARYSALSI